MNLSLFKKILCARVLRVGDPFHTIKVDIQCITRGLCFVVEQLECSTASCRGTISKMSPAEHHLSWMLGRIARMCRNGLVLSRMKILDKQLHESQWQAAFCFWSLLVGNQSLCVVAALRYSCCERAFATGIDQFSAACRWYHVCGRIHQ